MIWKSCLGEQWVTSIDDGLSTIISNSRELEIVERVERGSITII